MSIVILFVYYILGAVAQAFGRNGTMDPYLAAWAPNIVMAAAGGWLVWREDR